MTNKLPFETAKDFIDNSLLSASRLCSYQMPHALQTVRQFWQSSAPRDLVKFYFDASQGDAGRQLDACGPGNVVTLDPPLIVATSPL